jgi:hypothetical protein
MKKTREELIAQLKIWDKTIADIGSALYRIEIQIDNILQEEDDYDDR